jgi:peptide-N4-(N-acetyl-beta-glucosaminyl)asparagine amidase
MATTAADDQDQDRRFLGRVQAAIATVEAWDADPSLLAECRAQIPFQDIVASHTREDDVLYRGNALFLKQLTLYFKEKVMTWVNNPPCAKCGNADTTSRTSRGPTTPEEIEGRASRVEVYHCPTCDEATTTFARYNSVRKLFETRRGRCGEFANLFGLYCRAVGLEVRYCSDFTDHVWVECLIDGVWIMADACEGLIDKNAMYESGWNKSLSYIVGVTVDSVVDVTPRYTRRWFSPTLQAQRRAACSSEEQSQRILKQLNDALQQKCLKSRSDELDRRLEREQKMLSAYQQATEWTEEEKHGQGRISGSLQWKLSRREAGTVTENEETSSSSVQTWHVESFYPPTSDGGGVTISITPNKGIIVSRAECSDVGSAISVIVLDEAYLGCILQSRGFHSWTDVSDFVETLPKHRIVAIQGKGQKQEKEDYSKKGLLRLGGFVAPTGDDGLLYLGQVGATPSWARCAAYSEESSSSGMHVLLRGVKPMASMLLRLRTERDTVPRRVAWRLPESVMPLQTQLLATEEQKRTAFLRFAEQNGEEGHSGRHVGYATKPNAPVYLLDASAYPLAQMDGGWNTYHYLPDPLVPKDDVGIVVSTDCGFCTSFCCAVWTETFLISFMSCHLRRPRTRLLVSPKSTFHWIHPSSLVYLDRACLRMQMELLRRFSIHRTHCIMLVW